ncbi:MAG: exonuclease domain-containing protein [Candidatus Zipacnadales bacterium]
MEWARVPIAKASWVCVDVETTGLEVERGHRICEIGLVWGDIGGLVQTLSSLVNPGQPIPPEASQVSGITDEDVADAPAFAALAPQVCQLLRGAVIVAHNAPFDIGFLATELGNTNLVLPASPIIDTTVVAQTILGLQVRNLFGVAAALGLPTPPTHRALDDAKATWELLWHGLHVLRRQGVSTVSEVLEALLPPLPTDMPLSAKGPLMTIRTALANGTDLLIEYRGGHDVGPRHIRPVRLEQKGAQLQLAAFCYKRNAPRLFRTDRILSAQPVE